MGSALTYAEGVVDDGGEPFKDRVNLSGAEANAGWIEDSIAGGEVWVSIGREGGYCECIPSSVDDQALSSWVGSHEVTLAVHTYVK